MTSKGTVSAIIDEKSTTIDHDTGDVQRTVKGKLKGFGQGFKNYLAKGNKSVKIGADVFVGQFPETHPHAGKWCVQINFMEFPDQETANQFAAQVTPIVEGVMGVKALVRQ